MSSFTTPLIVQPLDDGRTWRLEEEFRYRVGGGDSEEIITVPKGFETVFASVPRAFWRVIPPWGIYGKATVIHDFCYRTRPYSRKRADEILLEGMKVLGVACWKRLAIYGAVRAFGWVAWSKYGDKIYEKAAAEANGEST